MIFIAIIGVIVLAVVTALIAYIGFWHTLIFVLIIVAFKVILTFLLHRLFGRVQNG